MAQGDIDDMCFAISDCFESIDDLILKFWFRRRFLEAPAQAYEQAVRGWQDPPFDLGRLQIYPAKRSQGLRPRQGHQHPPGSTPGERRRVAGDRGQAAGEKD